MSKGTVQFAVSGHQAGTALAAFLAAAMKVSGKKAKALLDGKHVFVNRKRVWMAKHRLEAGDKVEVLAGPAPAPDASSDRILKRDDDYLVVNKPAGILSCGEDGMEGLLRKSLRLPSAVAVHRLDRDTSGCLIMAVDAAAMERLVPVFKRHGILKEYHAIVRGRVSPPQFILDSPIEGEWSVTKVRTLDSNETASHVLLTLETGRTHQIRRHMASVRHPVVGDTQYGPADERDPRLRHIRRQMLHASHVAFTNPKTGIKIEAGAPLPRDFVETLAMLRLG